MRAIAVLSLVFAAAAICAAPAAAESTKQRLARLEQSLLELQAAQPGATDAALKISRLEQEVQTLTGRVEELTYRLDQANARLEAVSAALAADPQSAGAFGAAVSGGAATPSATTPGASTPSAQAGGGSDTIGRRIAESTESGGDVELPLDSDAAFQYASDFLRSGDYNRAQKAFELYLQAFPNSPRAADAQFRLGEIYLATGANAEAADAFIAHIKKYPNDPRTAEAHLKLGTAFSRLGKRDEACKVLKATKTKFPSAPQAVLTRVDLEMQRASCK
jgi:tol-pal system protein YbgF